MGLAILGSFDRKLLYIKPKN